jgi:hypothetical protein
MNELLQDMNAENGQPGAMPAVQPDHGVDQSGTAALTFIQT